MIQTHNIEIQQEFADAILCGDKTFVVCCNYKGYQKGDLIRFEVMDGITRDIFNELNKRTYKITYVSNAYGLKENHVVLAIKEEKDNGEEKDDGR